MNKNFEEAKKEREFYFQQELKTLEMIWNATVSAADANFNASRATEDSIMGALQKNGEEMMKIQEENLKEMLERALDTVESDQAIVNKFKEEIERYSVEAQMSLELQREKLKEVNLAGEQVEIEADALEKAIKRWQALHVIQALWGLMKAYVGMGLAIVTMQPEIAGAAVAEGAAAASEIAGIFDGITDIIEAWADLEQVLESLNDIGIDIEIPDIDGDLALDMADNWRTTLEKAYELKSMSGKFNDIR